MTLSELMTIRDFIRYATSCFNEAQLYFGHGTDNAWDDASALILHALHLPHSINPTILDANLTQDEKDKIKNLIHLRVTEKIPVPYLTHEAWFAGFSFYVDERVLIPRSPIAELIEKQFTPWMQSHKVHHILDLCTGSACIAIACAKYFPEAHIDASDISKEALTVAKINVLRHNLESQITLFESDLFEEIPAKKYDIIISNPPYVSEEEMACLLPEYKHEPAIGLTAGKDGLAVILRIIQKAKSYLNPHGILVVETGNSEVTLCERYPQIPFTWLDFERSDGGVFLLTAKELTSYEKEFAN